MRNKDFKISDTCYLCGLPNADTRDHIPPKGLFITNSQRLTLPAHSNCNIEFSKDEEYFRDVTVQQAAAFKMNGIDEILAKIWRSWRKEGKKRYQELIATAKPNYFKMSSGELRQSITVNPDRKKLERVAIKIARGIIYNDTGSVTFQNSYYSAYIPAISLLDVKTRDKDEPYWQAMNLNECLHTVFGPHFGARRIYVYTDKRETPIVMCFMGLILGSAFYIIITEIIPSCIKNNKLQILV